MPPFTMKALVIILCAVALSAVAEMQNPQNSSSLPRKQAKVNRLLSGRVFPRPPDVELTEKEKALDLDSFAGFKFGEAADSSSELYLHRTRGIKLEQPIRAFSHVQIGYTSFNPRLHRVHIWGNVKGWDAQSISNEVIAIRNFLSSRYGISSWKDYSGFLGRNSESRFKFENDNLSISVSGGVPFLALDVESKRIANTDSAEREAERQAVSFSEGEGFSELASLADTAKVIIDNEIKPTIPSGESSDIGLTNANLAEWERSETNNVDQVIFLPCRSESAGASGQLHWRPFVISPDGRIRKICVV